MRKALFAVPLCSVLILMGQAPSNSAQQTDADTETKLQTVRKEIEELREKAQSLLREVERLGQKEQGLLATLEKEKKEKAKRRDDYITVEIRGQLAEGISYEKKKDDKDDEQDWKVIVQGVSFEVTMEASKKLRDLAQRSVGRTVIVRGTLVPYQVSATRRDEVGSISAATFKVIED